MPTATSILKDVFGYDTFRPMQREVIENVLAGRDSLAVMPTGGGKSLCYQVPALLLDGLTVVVSPLISLMKDQIEQLHAAGVPALTLNSTLTPQTYAANMEKVRRGKVKLLYLAPETLLTPRVIGLLDEVKVSLFTIDEAHCISEWGHDFRPEYRQLVDARRRFPDAVCLALTATATERVREDIQTTLGFSHSNEFLASFNRPNLYIEVARRSNAFNQVLNYLSRYPDQSGIIYCFSRRQVDDLYEKLKKHGLSVRPYHAGLNDLTRKRNQEAFIRDDVQIIVATIAFGMGINKPNVRFVIHYDLPKSIEEYYQEIGRAGRDGLPAGCLLLYNNADIQKQHYFIDEKEGQQRVVAEKHLDDMVDYAENNYGCRRKPLLSYFGEEYTASACNNCDHCRPVNLVRPVPQNASLQVEPKQRKLPRAAAKTERAAASPDTTIPAQKFLSCVKRTGENFGMVYIVNVLTGVRNERILANKHDDLSTFNIGSELTTPDWIKLARSLINNGYINEEGNFPFEKLTLTDKALTALKQRAPIQVGLSAHMPPTSSTSRARAERAAAANDEEYNRALFAVLRQKRKDLADLEGVPPYVIFPDRTLVEMSTFYPQRLTSLKQISGVGKVKLERYGSAFLLTICDFCRSHNLKEISKPQ
jgi:ATP-dependent DNA helicase RecQ